MFLRFIQSNNLRALLFFALILFLPTQFGKHFWPSFAIIEGLRVDYLSPTVFLTDLLAIAFILFSIPFIRIPKIVFPVLLFVAIGIFFSSSPLSGWYQFGKLVEYLLLGFAIAGWFKKETMGIATGVLFGIGIWYETLIALLQFLRQSSLGGLFYFLGERTFSADTPGIANAAINGQLILRPYGTLPHPNVLAGFLVIAMLLCFAFLHDVNKKLLGIFLWGTLIVGTAGLVITLSRIAMVVFIVSGSALVVLFGNKKKEKIFAISISVFTGILVIGTLVPFLWERFLFSLSDESVVQRQLLMANALKMIRTHMLFGLGFGNFSTSVAQNGLYSGLLLLQPVHNIFLFLAEEGGLVFLLFSLWFLYYTCKKLFGVIQTKKTRYAFVLLLCVFVVFCIGQTDHYFVTLQQGQLLTTIVLSLSWNHIFRFANRT